MGKRFSDKDYLVYVVSILPVWNPVKSILVASVQPQYNDQRETVPFSNTLVIIPAFTPNRQNNVCLSESGRDVVLS